MAGDYPYSGEAPSFSPTPIEYIPMHPYTPPIPTEQQILLALLRIEKLLQAEVIRRDTPAVDPRYVSKRK